MSRKKFRLTKDIIRDTLAQINQMGIYVDAGELEIELPDSKDRVFYEVVMEERKTEDAYLVTGNMKHFPARPYIVTPRQMLDIILDTVEE